jgi:RNA polymerase sigma factor (TIGR02999 family)
LLGTRPHPFNVMCGFPPADRARVQNYNRRMAEPADITGLLTAWSRGDKEALEQLMPLVYAQLHAQARRYMRSERAGLTLQSTALVHEVYLRLTKAHDVNWSDRAHFFALSAQIMRRILVDAARARTASKRGGGAPRAGPSPANDPDRIPAAQSDTDLMLCALDDALDSLAQRDPRRVKVIELRFFAGLSVEETAGMLQVSPQTVMRDWRLAKVWLARELGAE